MTEPLPAAIQRYFVGKNARDFATAISGFGPSAVARDEGQTLHGPAAIRAWIEETAARYDDRAEVRKVTWEGDQVDVLAQVSGTFPGSPILLRFKFALDGNQITRLDIAAA